jgi:toxin ParE1/3/4
LGVIKRRPQVAIDLVEHAEYLSNDSLDTALRFLAAVESTFIFVAKNPEIGALCKFKSPQSKHVRFWPIKGFEKHLLFYQSVSDGIEVARVLHGARDLEAILTN